MPRQYRIGVLITKGIAFMQKVVVGVSQAAQARKSWSVRLAGAIGGSFDALLDWRPDGIISDAIPAELDRMIPEDSSVTTMQSLDIPVVCISSRTPAQYLPTVRPGDRLAGEVAANYLLGLNLEHFAFWHTEQQAFSDRRRDGFFLTLAENGIPASHMYELPPFDASDWRQRDRLVEEWISGLPKPVGVLSCHDLDAYYLCGICRDVGMDIPNEVALLGIDDNQMLCGLASPPLSSVRLAFGRVGETAVEVLSDILGGRDAPREPVLIPPIGVVSRGSTDMLAVDDPDVATAARHIRDHAAEGLSVVEVLAAVPLSRRSLERRFSAAFGRTLADEIRRIQIEHAKCLLMVGDLRIAEVARQSGFRSAEYFTNVFRREAGVPPTHYRRQRPHR